MGNDSSVYSSGLFSTQLLQPRAEFGVQYLHERSGHLNSRQQTVFSLIPSVLRLLQIYQWMSQIREKCTEVVTQHFLGTTDEARPGLSAGE